MKLFLALYSVVSILTVFTSNDIIILTLTPFIYYFARDAGIDPRPILFTEFFAANTWSMMLYIGNPTNIVIASAFSLRFDEYTLYLFLPTIAAGLSNLLLLYFVFRKALKVPLKKECTCDPAGALTDRWGAILGLAILTGCIIGLAVAPYAGVEMWQVSVIFAIVLLGMLAGRDILWGFIPRANLKNNNSSVKATAYRLPWSIAPFVLSLLVMVEALKVYEITRAVGDVFAAISGGSIIVNTFIYGFSSALSANVLNNIPMTIAFVPVMESLHGRELLAAAFATTIGSNLGANLTPLGSLAGIMWMSILSAKECRISFTAFMKYGAIITPITLISALGTLYLELLIF
ncbi:MAG: ArsB/NhaD family transporter [Methanomicrobiales archaeon]|nr:ArsB/NhaD family transporter [Methanomicrobiales archaeon]